MEWNCSGSSRCKSSPKDGFTDLLLSWSLEQISDENLYKNKVEKIPESFDSADQYLGSYVFPLLEEVRAELASALDTVYKAPFAEVTSFKKSKHGKLLYDVNVGHWRNEISDRGKEPYRTLPGDFVLLSELKPGSASDLQCPGLIYSFAFVKKISEDESSHNITPSRFTLKTAGSFEIEGLHEQIDSLYVVYLMNTTTHKRIWNALTMRRNMKIVEKVLTKSVLAEENCELCPVNFRNEVEEKLGTNLLSKINESQHEAILASISKTGCSHKSSVELIWGPPGTGKTTTLSILLYILLRLNVRTLICTPTNIAITELASRVTALMRSSVKAECEKSFSPCPLGEMLIFGNKGRLKVGSNVEEIFLDYRVESLINCLVPSTGWKHCIASMLAFLEDCVSQHQQFVEDELKKSEELLDGETQQSGSKSFLEYARDRFTVVASNLRSCMSTIITHLPISFILEENYERIVQLISLLDTFKKMLFDDSCMTSDDLEAIFLKQVMIVSESAIDTSSLHYIRSQCLSILRSLQASFSQLSFPVVLGQDSATNFCFQKASLIFCTISSAYKLHSVDMKPFQVLVIDEAAQVKECETTIALQIADVTHAILVGDEMQLPATVSSKLSEKAGFGRSLFERLSLMGHPKHLLDVQYRMHPSISQFPNSNFYSNQIKDAPNVLSKSYEKCYLEGRMFGPYSFINIDGGRDELDDIGHSRRNMVEVAVIVKLVQKLFKACNGSKVKLSIGLISPYASQVAAIRDKLQSKYDNLERFTVKVNSVDGFQGGEEDIIIISTVRSNEGGSIGFLANRQRTNVALTRARHCLWILGSEGTLNRSSSVWEALVSEAKDRRCFFNAADDIELRKTIIDVKTQFEQLDDLLSGESTLFKNSRWQVLFSDYFRKTFQKLKCKKSVINFLLKLASGWRPKKTNVDWKCESSSYIVKQFNVDDYCVVCSTDIVKDSLYKQVLKVWDILPKSETTKLLKRLDSMFSMYTDEFVSHCNDKLLEGNLEVPNSWSLSCDIPRFRNSNNTKLTSDTSATSAESRSYVENTKVSESLLLMKFYSLSTGSVKHLLSDVEGREVDLPFEVTDEEREIILFPKSSFILGRSGTGKTTILTMKLYQKFQQFCIASRDSVISDNSVRISNEVDVDQHHCQSKNTVLHQLFVTVSPKLCHAVKKHVSHLKSFAAENISGSNNFSGMDDVDEMAEFNDIPDTFLDLQQEKYPLIITFQKFLMMLDGTLGQSYFQRFPDVKGSSHYGKRRSIALRTFMRKNEVTFDRFWSLYWPHFNLKLAKSLDASRVFTEIMSHIKGGMQEGEACDCKRSRADYVSLCEYRISTLSAEERNVIYDIFEDYEKMKLERGEFDLADFVTDIHVRLKNEDLLGDKMDFVYVDEVQDLTMRQISLFRYICKNVDEGFVFSGDTAQTIARGIDFRFEDIRSLFYHEFLMKSRDCELPGRREKGLVSDMFRLSQNFRTHMGVLRLAQSVIDLICHYFPQSIDSLAPETSFIYGESPVILQPGSDENMIISIFGHSGKNGGKWVGFGADQVILVRDDSARNEVSSYIGDQALVLTILECKGLEFQDVLLYNFFGSSPMSNQWRVVYEFLKEKDLLDGTSPKSFSKSRHNIMCSELKQLYVAITRTRQRLWICENNIEVSKPMFDYWKRLGLVQERKLDDSLAETMQRASSPEEWKSQGIKLFWEKNYEMAIMCFEKAGEESWEKRAKASGIRAAAESLHGSNPKEASKMLREAAEIFDSIDRAESAAECFCDLGEYERAGRIYLEKCGRLGLEKAGECFTLAGSYETAAEVYAKGNFLTECLSACIKGSCFDIGLQYINYWKQQASLDTVIMARFKEIDEIALDFLQNCAVQCHKANDNASVMKFVRAFPSMESKRNFLKSLDLFEELLVLEEESGNFDEAAEIAKRLGDTLSEIDLLEKAEQFENVSTLILSYVLAKSLWVSGNRGWPVKSFPEKMELLNRAMSAAHKVSGTFYASIWAESNIFLCERRTLSEQMQCYHASVQYETPIGEVLSVRGLLDAHFQMHASKYEWDRELHLHPRSFDERMSNNQVSGGTLFHLWNLLKAESLDILECLDGLEKPGPIQVEGTARFCFSYFGVRLSDDSSGNCLLMSPDAAWVGNVDKRFIRIKRNVATLEARHFASAARKFWLQELYAVGLRVMEALQRIYQNSMVKRLPKHFQSMCLLYIFDTANFFLELNSFDLKKARKLQDAVALSTEYFKIVFPLDPQQSLSEDMISLRETELSKKLLEEIVSRNICTAKTLTYGQIGQAAMILLGSGKLGCAIYKRICERLSEDSSWKSLFEYLRRSMEADCLPITTSAEALSRELYGALVETYNVNWRACDYISPSCFFYLVDRLLILVPHSRGFFFTSKSSFVEQMICLSSDANPRSSLVTTDNKSCPKDMVEFVARMIEQCLCNGSDTAEWIKRSRILVNWYFPVLMLRLLMILCLLCLNWDFLPFDIVYAKLARRPISSLLPRKFCEALRLRSRRDSYASAVAGAFKAIEDPLVVVVSSDNNRNFTHPDAIVLDLRSFSCKNEIMKALFPQSQDQPTPVEQNVYEHSSIVVPPLASSKGENPILEPSEMASKTAPNSSLENGKENLQTNWIGEISDALELLSNKDDGDVKSLVLRKKAEVEEHASLLTTAVRRLTDQTSHSGEDEDLSRDATRIVEEVNALSSFLCQSDLDSEALSKMREILKSLEARKPQLNALLSRNMGQNESNETAVCEENDDDEKVSDRNDDAEEMTTEDSAAVASNANASNKGAACSQGKGKNKNKNKSKKRKGGKKK